MRRRFDYRAAQASVRVFAHVFLGYRVEGLEHIPPEGAFLLAANHKSYLDPPFLGASLEREMRYFAKKQLFSIPILGPMIRRFGAVPVDRDSSDRQAIATALRILRSGEGLMIFPEGRRIRRPGLGPPKQGVGMLALQAGVPVVPAHIRGTWEPRRALFRRIPARIRIGPPLTFEVPEDPTARRRQYGDVAARILEEIARLGEADRDAAPGE